MSDHPLTKIELMELREKLRELRTQIFRTREDLADDEKIILQEYDQMKEAEEVVSRRIKEINNTIFNQILTDIQEPKREIEFSIDKSKQGIAELQEINGILQFINAIIQLGGKIILTIGTGNVANIASIVDVRELPRLT